MSKKKAIVILLILTLLATALFGCGNSGKKEPADSKDLMEALSNVGRDLLPRIDALKYGMSLYLDVNRDKLSETVTITIQNNASEPVEEIVIRDMAAASLAYDRKNYAGYGNKRTSEIKDIYRGAETGSSLEYRLGDDESIIIVSLDAALNSGETTEITVEMETSFPRAADRFSVQEKKEGKIFALSFCFPYLADNVEVDAKNSDAAGEIRRTLIGNISWDTAPFFFDGESRSADLADYEVEFVVAGDYEVVSTGEFVQVVGADGADESSESSESSEERTYSIVANSVRDFAIVACNYMVKDTFDVDGVTVNNYYLKTGKGLKLYRDICRLTAEDSLRIFTEALGPYPYKELDVVDCSLGEWVGGMEYPGLVMINGTLFFNSVTPNYGAKYLVDVIAHEIGHQWFYSSVGSDEYREGWLDEGFTTWLERETFGLADCESNRYVRELNPDVATFDEIREARKSYITYCREEYDHFYLNLSPEEYEKGRQYAEGEYEVAFLFLLELRELWGEEKFNDFLKTYYNAYAGHISSTEDVVALIRMMDEGGSAEEILAFYIKE